MEKIVRSICLFTNDPTHANVATLQETEKKLAGRNFSVQTRRLCASYLPVAEIDAAVSTEIDYISIGKIDVTTAREQLSDFLASDRVTFNIDLSTDEITEEHTDILYEVMQRRAEHTFNFSFSFNIPNSSPFFTSTNYEQNGFSIGLQPTNLSIDATSQEEWFANTESAWKELIKLFSDNKDFLGIDSSIAPLFDAGSFIAFAKQLYGNFSDSVVTDFYTKTSDFIKTKNPKPVGLCGLMFPALEDSELAKEYDAGNFSIERNAFLSLHSGLGIDTYPIGIDQDKRKITEILKLMQTLSKKYQKPLSVRFVSDGKTKIGEESDFKNQYLKNVTVREI